MRLDEACKRVVWRSDPVPDAQAIVWADEALILLGPRTLQALDPTTGALRNEKRW